MRVGIRFGFCQETTRLEWGGRIWKIFGTRQKRGFTKGRSCGSFDGHLAFGFLNFLICTVFRFQKSPRCRPRLRPVVA